jgi:hypothetical protein
MKKSNVFCLILCFNFVFHFSIAQNKFTISGTIQDAETGEKLAGVAVYATENTALGTVSNAYGFYSLSLPKGEYTLKFQLLGYANNEKKIVIDKNMSLPIQLAPQVLQSQEVVITAKRAENKVASGQLGQLELNATQIKSLPAMLGEVDVMRVLQLLPGVQSGSEASSGLLIRGGTPDQTLTILDEAPLYNTGHLFGFFSVFNADAISGVRLQKAGASAHYESRLAGVADFRLKEGNSKQYHAEGGIGLLSSRLLVEGPIIKEKSSFMLSGRRSYIDVLTKPIEVNGNQGLPYYFYDINGKVNISLSEKDKLYGSIFVGKDALDLLLLNGRIRANTAWGNQAFSLRWNRNLGSKAFLNVTGVYNRFFLQINSSYDNVITRLSSGIADRTLKADLDIFPSIRHTLKVGAAYTFHTFTPRSTFAQATSSNGTTTFNEDTKNVNRYAHESAIYAQYETDVTPRLKATAGMRGVIFTQIGEFMQYRPALNDTLRFGKGEKVVSYPVVEPRFTARWLLDSISSIKVGFNYSNQFVHQVSVSGNALPFDFWVPSSVLLRPQQGWQISTGYFRTQPMQDREIELSAEIYYRKMYHQLEYREGYAPGFAGEIEYDLVSGEGQSYGLELLAQKNTGRLQGWVAYTLSKTDRFFALLNDGNSFPFRYDRRHDLAVTGSYFLSDRWKLGATFVYATGAAMTIPVRRYLIEGQVVNEYGKRNGFRMESYHRLDISATWTPRKNDNRKFQSYWTFAIYNAYNRKNPFLYFIETQGNATQGTLNVQAKKLYIFPIMPSITWNFRW